MDFVRYEPKYHDISNTWRLVSDSLQQHTPHEIVFVYLKGPVSSLTWASLWNASLGDWMTPPYSISWSEVGGGGYFMYIIDFTYSIASWENYTSGQNVGGGGGGTT